MQQRVGIVKHPEARKVDQMCSQQYINKTANHIDGPEWMLSIN